MSEKYLNGVILSAGCWSFAYKRINLIEEKNSRKSTSCLLKERSDCILTEYTDDNKSILQLHQQMERRFELRWWSKRRREPPTLQLVREWSLHSQEVHRAVHHERDEYENVQIATNTSKAIRLPMKLSEQRHENYLLKFQFHILQASNGIPSDIVNGFFVLH